MSGMAFRYVKATLVAKSPIKLGSGAEQLSDSDVLVDASGAAFIPSTTLAGVMRHYVRALKGEDDKDYVDEWFGHIVPGKDEGSESLVRVYDARPLAAVNISMRDGVRLDDNKTAVPQGKFDYQVVDAGAKFRLRMRLCCKTKSREEADELVRCVLRGFEAGEIMVGGKTSRGFGRFGVADAMALYVDLGQDEGVKRYIGFDWDRSAFEPFKFGEARPVLHDGAKVVGLELVSPLIVRDYATVERSGHESKLVDAETLVGAEGKPVIPGTSWAGAFRHHMRWILTASGYDANNGRGDTADAFLNRVFGSVDGGRAFASKIEFCETAMDGSSPVNITRTAIDRFTGGAADQMLFTNRIAYGGTTTLEIRWRNSLGGRDKLDEQDERLLKTLVDVCVNDLCDGTLAIGGMTAIGCGVFRKGHAGKDEVTS